jgi:hypothetical protein
MHSRDSISRPRPTTMPFYVRYRADGRKNISSTFMMTYSSFPWRRRLFLLSDIGLDNAVDGSRGVNRGVSNTKLNRNLCERDL